MTTYCISATSKTSDSVNIINHKIQPNVVLVADKSYLLFSGSLDLEILALLQQYFHVHDDVTLDTIHLYET